MNHKSISLVVLISTLLVTSYALASAGRVEHLETYRQQGIEQTDAQRGRKLWYATKDERSCASCHGEMPADAHSCPGKVNRKEHTVFSRSVPRVLVVFVDTSAVPRLVNE